MRRLFDGAALAALESSTLVPPPRPADLSAGPTAELRDAMARFASGDDHLAARRDVEAAIATVDVELLTRETRERTRLAASDATDRPVDAVADIGAVVPTQALLATLGVDADDIRSCAVDVRAIVGVIGRGEPLNASVEAAARRLAAAFAGHPNGPVAAISMLYQNHDATAALFGSVLLARATDTPRPNALARTIRIATADTVLADTPFAAADTSLRHVESPVVDADDDDVESDDEVEGNAAPVAPGELVLAGETIEVSLDGEDVEFGAGVHRCPGEALAVAIVDAMVGVLDDLDCTVDTDAIRLGADGRATALPLRRSTESEQDPDQDVISS